MVKKTQIALAPNVLAAYSNLGSPATIAKPIAQLKRKRHARSRQHRTDPTKHQKIPKVFLRCVPQGPSARKQAAKHNRLLRAAELAASKRK